MDILLSIAQISAAVGTLSLAAFAYFQFRLLHETRVAQERPQVIVDADYSDQNVVDVVVRNIGSGAAKEISFDFSAPLVHSFLQKGSEFEPLNELPYFKNGIDFLAPGAEIRCAWDTYTNLLPLLREMGLEDGITITSRYESLAGDPYETKWRINPLLLSGAPQVMRRGMDDLAKAVDRIAKRFDRVTTPRELRVATKTERQRENERLRAEIEAEQGDG